MARLVFLFCLIMLCKGNKPYGLKLEQVLILSRHNIRTPLTTRLDEFSPKKFSTFNESDGELTRKGALMESYMAEYFKEWFTSEEFIKGCPKEKDVYIYSNTKSRTRDTAKWFAASAFPSCNITYHHNENIEVFDPIFHPIFHNNSESFIKKMIDEMENILNAYNLTDSYLELNRILDIENSDVCKQKKLCDLSKNKTQIVCQEGEEPEVKGPLAFGTQLVDAFLMSYYEGFPLENVAWGQITTEEQWELLTKIIRLNLKVRFRPSACKDIGKPLLEYIFNLIRNESLKVIVVVGHDANIRVVLKALEFKKIDLVNQFEPYPIGGKLVFQKWTDGARKFLKVEYIYPTFLQLRNSEKLSLAHPPQKILLEMRECKINDEGYCPWEDFAKLFF